MLKKRLEKLESRIETFEEKSGLQIDTWDIGKVAEAVRIINSDQKNVEWAFRSFLKARKELSKSLKQINRSLSSLDLPESIDVPARLRDQVPDGLLDD